MTEPSESETPQAKVVAPPKGRVNIVWAVPLLAIGIGIWLAWQAVISRGPDIELRFKTAEGLEAGKTKIKFKNVEVGTVETIRIGDDRKSAVVSARMTSDAKRLLVDDTRFWIVRPRIAGGQVSGLTTLLSGAYIGIDVGHSDVERYHFVGLETQPVITADEPGREFELHARDVGSLDVGSPVFFRRIQVGEVTAIDLDEDGKGVTLRAFVRSPSDRWVTKNARFWQASGIDVSVGSDGVKVSTQSLVSVLLGGIAFQVPDPDKPGEPAIADEAFSLFDNEKSAMKRSEDQLYKFTTYFDSSIQGLSVGARVDFRGVAVGEVRSIDIQFDQRKRDFRFPVVFDLYRDVLPAKVAQAGQAFDQDRGLQDAIRMRGLRVQLRSSGLLTGQKFLAIDFFRNAGPIGSQALIAADGRRVIPSEPASLDELQDSVARIAKKVEKIPFDGIATDLRNALQQTRDTMAGAEKVLGRIDTEVAPELLSTMAEAKRSIKNAGDVLASDSPIQQDLQQALVELRRTAESLRGLTEYLQRHPESLLRGQAIQPPLTPQGLTERELSR